MKAIVRLWFLIAAFCAVALLFLGSTQDVFAGYQEEVLADEPFAYFRLDEEPGALDAGGGQGERAPHRLAAGGPTGHR